MARTDPRKEATLREVLAEVSLVDMGGVIKRGLAMLGCWGLIMAVVIFITTATEGAGYGLSDFGVPEWLVWLLFTWVFVHAATAAKSYHEWEMRWYFPKLHWAASLLFAAYLVGFVQVILWMRNFEGWGGYVAYLAWLGYASPFMLFISIIEVGHNKLLERRTAASSNLTGRKSSEG